MNGATLIHRVKKAEAPHSTALEKWTISPNLWGLEIAGSNPAGCVEDLEYRP